MRFSFEAQRFSSLNDVVYVYFLLSYEAKLNIEAWKEMERKEEQ